MDKQNLLKAFTDRDEKLLFSKIFDLTSNCTDKCFSDFIDPIRADKYIKLLIGLRDFDLNYLMYGGTEDCERKMLGFSPSYAELTHADFPIDPIEITYNQSFNRKLDHRDYLGSLIGLGIDRSRIGDIVITDKGCITFISREIASYVCVNLEKVGSVKVRVGLICADTISIDAEEGVEKRVTVASLRLDNVLSAAFNISRSKSADLISGEKAFVNWSLAKSTSRLLKEGDMITLRGHGRVKLKEIYGTTKKDRIAIKIQLNSHNKK